MKDLQTLEQVLKNALPVDLHDEVPRLAVKIQSAIDNIQASEANKDASDYDVELATVVAALAGKELRAEATVLSFGSGNQIGDISIRDIAGGNIAHVSVNVKIERKTVQQSRSNNQRQRPQTAEEREALLTARINQQGRRKGSARTNSVSRAHTNGTNTRPPHVIYNDFLNGIRMLAFAIIGFMFGWNAIVAITNTQYLYSPGNQFSEERLIAGAISGAIGLIVSLSFVLGKQRSRKYAGWDHILGIVIAGALMHALFKDVASDIFWIGGIPLWIIFWLTALGGYRQFR